MNCLHRRNWFGTVITMVYLMGILIVMFSACTPIERDKNQIVARDEITAIEINNYNIGEEVSIITDRRYFDIFTEAFNNSIKERAKDHKLDISTHKINIHYGNNMSQTFSLWLSEDDNDAFYQPHFMDPTYVYRIPNKYKQQLQSILRIKE